MKTGIFCYGCMREKKEPERYCSYCGFNQEEYMSKRDPQALKPGIILQGRYVLGKVLGKGGFGITYIGYDTKLHIKVAVKEYFPSGLAMRTNPGDTEESCLVTVTEKPERYQKELERFIQEARTLASFNQETGIVTVIDVFRANNTGYYVMDHLPGKSLKEIIRKRNRPMGLEEVLRLLTPVFNSLKTVHKNHIIHRDISPDNLVINNSGKLTLIDFGASRNLDKDQKEGLILKHGYSPIEQYQVNGRQGPWTDVYSLCATIYYMMTLRVPPRADIRYKNDQILPLNQLVNVPAAFSEAIMTGLAVDPGKRFQSVSALSNALLKSVEIEDEEQAVDPVKILFLVLAGLVFLAIIGLAILLLQAPDDEEDTTGKKPTTTQAVTNDKTVTKTSVTTTAAATATPTTTTEKPEPKLEIKGVSTSNREPDYHDYEEASAFRTISVNGGAESFGYPIGFFSHVEKTDDDFYTFSTKEGGASYRVGPVYGLSDPEGYIYEQYDHYKSILITKSEIHNGVDVNPAKSKSFLHCVVAGIKKNDSSRGIYFIAGLKDGVVYTQEFEYEFDNDHKLSHQNYVIECLYQTCSFSGTSHKIRDFDEYKRKNGDW